MDLNAFSWSDTSGDGVGDVGYLDSNADGLYDTAALDSQADGYVESYAWDTSGDGVFDTISTDTDLDGYLDSHGWDVTGDGVIDQLTGPATGGAVVDVSGSASDYTPNVAVVGPPTVNGPQANLAELYNYTNNPFEQFMIWDTINTMNDTAGIWTLPNMSW